MTRSTPGHPAVSRRVALCVLFLRRLSPRPIAQVLDVAMFGQAAGTTLKWQDGAKIKSRTRETGVDALRLSVPHVTVFSRCLILSWIGILRPLPLLPLALVSVSVYRIVIVTVESRQIAFSGNDADQTRERWTSHAQKCRCVCKQGLRTT